MERAEELFYRLKDQGEKAIDEFILMRKSEELFLDFKRSADNGGGRVMHQNDRNNLAKAISGFGNSEGGIIIWGIECSRGIDNADIAKAKAPIQNIKRFVSWIEGAISGSTVPAHPKVQNCCVEINKSGSGYVITLVTKSEIAPHQCVYDKKYYIRSGANFDTTPHAVLAGMFGRRPQPIVYNMYTISPVKIESDSSAEKVIVFSVGFMIGNKGPAIARDLYLHVKMFLPGDNCEAAFEFSDSNFTAYNLFGVWASAMSKDNFRIAPEVIVQPLILHFRLKPPFSKELFIEEVLGCEGAPIRKIEFKQPAQNVERLYNEFIANSMSGKESEEFVKRILKIPKEEAEE